MISKSKNSKFFKESELFFHTARFLIRPYKLSDYNSWLTAHQAAFPKQNEFDLERKTGPEISKKEFSKFVKQSTQKAPRVSKMEIPRM